MCLPCMHVFALNPEMESIETIKLWNAMTNGALDNRSICDMAKRDRSLPKVVTNASEFAALVARLQRSSGYHTATRQRRDIFPPSAPRLESPTMVNIVQGKRAQGQS